VLTLVCRIKSDSVKTALVPANPYQAGVGGLAFGSLFGVFFDSLFAAYFHSGPATETQLQPLHDRRDSDTELDIIETDTARNSTICFKLPPIALHSLGSLDSTHLLIFLLGILLGPVLDLAYTLRLWGQRLLVFLRPRASSVRSRASLYERQRVGALRE
jgi:hypothetical protein